VSLDTLSEIPSNGLWVDFSLDRKLDQRSVEFLRNSFVSLTKTAVEIGSGSGVRTSLRKNLETLLVLSEVPKQVLFQLIGVLSSLVFLLDVESSVGLVSGSPEMDFSVSEVVLFGRVVEESGVGGVLVDSVED